MKYVLDCVFIIVFLPGTTLLPTVYHNGCLCHWKDLTPWTQCSSSCGGGVRRGTFDAYTSCRGAEEYCGAHASLPVYCNTICYNGGHFVSNYYNGQCVCKPGKGGRCCEKNVEYCRSSPCKNRAGCIEISGGYRCTCLVGTTGKNCEIAVTCGRPSSINDGSFRGSYYSYGHMVTYTCNNGYKMADTSRATLRCTEHGSWSHTAPECIYAEYCRSSPCKNHARCRDLLGGYRCTCLNGTTGKNCEIDIQSPVYDHCPGNREVFTSNKTCELTWTEPVFHDPMGEDVKVTKNYPVNAFKFPWGRYTVQYSAVKPSNGLTNECAFNISIKPHPCKPIVVPKNGFVVCNNWMTDYANVCQIHCKKGYILPPPYTADDWYNCGSSGSWIPRSTPSECLPELLHTDDVKVDQDVAQLFDCSNHTETEAVAHRYIEDLLDSNFNPLCMEYRSSCNMTNVRVDC